MDGEEEGQRVNILYWVENTKTHSEYEMMKYRPILCSGGEDMVKLRVSRVDEVTESTRDFHLLTNGGRGIFANHLTQLTQIVFPKTTISKEKLLNR